MVKYRCGLKKWKDLDLILNENSEMFKSKGQISSVKNVKNYDCKQ